MALPSDTSEIITCQDRGTADTSLPGIVARLTDVARVAYGQGGYAELDWGAGAVPKEDPNRMVSGRFIGVLSLVKAYRPYTGYRTKPYLSDLHTLINAIEQRAPHWLARQLNAQMSQLENQRLRHFSDIGQVRSIARDYVQLRDKLAPIEHETREVSAAPGDISVVEVETARSIRDREEQARRHFQNEWVDLLFNHPRRHRLFNELARSELTAHEAIENAFRDARDGMHNFQDEIAENPGHIWRYPPIILGVLSDLGLVDMAAPDLKDDPFIRYMRDIARLRSEKWWESTLFVAGILIVTVSLTLAVPAGAAAIAAGIVVNAVDIGLAAHSGWKKFETERENEYAAAAQAFAQGQPLTERASSYGPIALEGAVALLGAFSTVRDARRLSDARRGGGKLADPGTADSGTQRRPAVQATDSAEETQHGQVGTRAVEPEDRAVDRLAHPERADGRLPKGASETAGQNLPAVFRGVKHEIVPSSTVLDPMKEGIIRAQLKLHNRWLEGGIYLVRETYYFVLDVAKEWAILSRTILRETISTTYSEPYYLLWEFAGTFPKAVFRVYSRKAALEKLYKYYAQFLGPSISKIRDPGGKLIRHYEAYSSSTVQLFSVAAELAVLKSLSSSLRTRLLHIVEEIAEKGKYTSDFYRSLQNGGLQRIEVTSIWPDKGFPKQPEAFLYWEKRIIGSLEDKLVTRRQLTTEYISPYGYVVPPGGILYIILPSYSQMSRATITEAAQNAVRRFADEHGVPTNLEIIVGVLDRGSRDLNLDILLSVTF